MEKSRIIDTSPCTIIYICEVKECFGQTNLNKIGVIGLILSDLFASCGLFQRNRNKIKNMGELVELIKYSGPSVLLIVVGLVWGKNLIEYFFKESIELKKFELNHDFEKFKSDIDQQNRNFQHSLDTRLNEFNIKYSKLHEERAEVIKELYVRLIELQSAMLDYTARGQSVIDGEEIKDARLQRVNKALFDYNSFYIPRKIFFNSEITNKLNNLAQEYWNKGWDYSFITTQLKNGNYPEDIHKEYYEKIKTINTIVQNDFSKLIEELENEFRKLLGVD